MARIVVRRCLLVPLLLTLLLVSSLPVMARPSRPAQTDLPAQCFPRQDAQDDLTTAEISALFDTVIRPAGRYQDYDFDLDVENTPPGALMPVLVKSVGGIESDWIQFRDGKTLVSINRTDNPANDSCDYGLMQVNSQNRELFDRTPSLRANTDGNMAAGATKLADWWNFGTPGNAGPAVNDLDPERLLNWYYALANYNGGPGEGKWVNNPNCGRPDLVDICGVDSDFRRSRGFGDDEEKAIWDNLSPDNYPYQERVLYNLAYPRYPEGEPAQ